MNYLRICRAKRKRVIPRAASTHRAAHVGPVISIQYFPYETRTTGEHNARICQSPRFTLLDEARWTQRALRSPCRWYATGTQGLVP